MKVADEVAKIITARGKGVSRSLITHLPHRSDLVGHSHDAVLN